MKKSEVLLELHNTSVGTTSIESSEGLPCFHGRLSSSNVRDNTLRDTSKDSVEQELFLSYPMQICNLNSGLVSNGGTTKRRIGEGTIKIPHKVVTN